MVTTKLYRVLRFRMYGAATPYDAVFNEVLSTRLI
jgi:hypothetical protein